MTVEQRPRGLAGVSPADHSEPGRWLVVEQQILRDRHGRDEIDVLMDRDNPLRKRLVSAGGADRSSLIFHHPRVRRDHAGDDFGERRFAGAVLADEAADAPSANRKIDLSQRLHGAEPLNKAPALEDDAGALGRRLISMRRVALALAAIGQSHLPVTWGSLANSAALSLVS